MTGTGLRACPSFTLPAGLTAAAEALQMVDLPEWERLPKGWDVPTEQMRLLSKRSVKRLRSLDFF